MQAQPPIILDFIHGNVVTATAGQPGAVSFEQFLQQQQRQLTAQGQPPQS